VTRLALFEARATRVLETALGLGLIAMVLLNVANAVGRYSGLPTLTGADELLIYAMIWLVMIGAVVVTRRRDHLAIDLLPQRIGGAAERLLVVAVDAATASVSAFVAWHSFVFVERIAAIEQTSMGLGIPMVIPHAAVTVGFAGMAISAVALLVGDLLAVWPRSPATTRGPVRR
jgi:TRAP-type C4-dicarboxylate transport system permease small subunit